MFIDILWAVITAAIIVAAITLFIYWVIKTSSGKIALAGLIAVILLAAVAGCFAEETEVVVLVYGVEPVNETTIRVIFECKGEYLSWYEELQEGEMFDTNAEYRVTLFNDEVIDSVKEQPSG